MPRFHSIPTAALRTPIKPIPYYLLRFYAHDNSPLPTLPRTGKLAL